MLLEKYKCNTCYSKDRTKTGLAFVDVAERYHGDSKALALLTIEINGAHGAAPRHCHCTPR